MIRMTQGLSITCLIAVAAIGCGVNKEVHQKSLDELNATQRKLNQSKRTVAARDKQIAELENQLNATAAERDQVSQAKTAAEREQQKRISELTSDMNATRQELTALRAQRDKAQKRLAAFRKLNDRFRSLVDTGKLNVAFRNGQMVLELPSEVLFASGRARLSSAGETALAEVLNILQEFRDRRFLVAGHTDNLRIRGRRFRNNWYLSTARAVRVLEFMIENGFDPKNLGAAGYGEFDPVAPNDTPENRQRNRRIEIILIPDLSELPNLQATPS